MRITLLCGGVGGARAALALAENLPAEQLTFVVNTGDDFHHLGLEIWPDWDTVIYTLSGLGDCARGWGRQDEGVRAMEELRRLGGPDWFHLGDRDLALHVFRSWAIAQGLPRARVAEDIARRLGVEVATLRVTDGSLATEFELASGERMDFQTWFVRHQGKPEVARVRCMGEGSPTQGVLQAISGCDLLVLAPSNPYLSIFPMLEVEAVGQTVRERSGPTWAVSPLVGGKAVKGPLDALISQMSPSSGQQAIVDLYQGWVQALLLPDEERSGLAAGAIRLEACRTALGTPAARAEFAADLVALWKSRA